MIIRYSPSLLAGLLLILLLEPVSAFWPFKQKRFNAEALVDAGQLGLDGIGGRVVGIGDWNGDKSSDLFTLSDDGKTLQVYLWDRAGFKYTAGPNRTFPTRIVNVVPADWNHDGRLDVLVVLEAEKHGWWGGEASVQNMKVLLGGADGTFGDTWDVASSSAAQAIVFDADGSLRPSLLGYQAKEGSKEAAPLVTWRNSGTSLIPRIPSLQKPEQACTLANPHSSAFVDIDGDCVPDLVLHCTGPRTSQQSIQIWLNRGEEGYELARTFDLPKGAGPLSYADMNRDGTIDIIFPTCGHHSTSTGIGTDCSINVAYNKQIPICGSEGPILNADGSLRCRGWGELCVADPNFEFNLSQRSKDVTSIPLSTLTGSSSLLLSIPDSPHITLPLRPGDYNVDGYPDLVLTLVNSTARGGTFGSKQGTQARVLENVACSTGVPGCANGEERSFWMGQGKGWEALDRMTDVGGASWIDIDDDGSLDILVQRSGDQEEGKVAFVQNNFYHDAFFLKAQVLNGACDGECHATTGGKGYSALGGVHAGSTYKFTVLDTLGRRGAQQVPQLPQSTYHSLGLPYAFIGLGRTNNYVERMSIGSALHSNNVTDLDSIIPNSQILINPPSPLVPAPDEDPSTRPSGPVLARSSEWRTELFLQPGEWVAWVAASVLGTVLALGGVVWFLHEREKREDEAERRRALHAINFQAL